MNVKDLIKKLEMLPATTLVVLENPNTGFCKPVLGLEAGRFSTMSKEFTHTDSVEEHNAIIIM